MAQVVKIIDLSKSYIPGDPNSFPNNLEFTAQEDSPEKANPIMPYEGFNFLPTSYGYRSYFGTTPALTLEALPKPCDEILTIQSDTYQNMLVALCSDGIRTATAGSTVWTLAISLPDDWTTSSTYRAYTWCVIENHLYIYRQGYSKVIKVASNLAITEFTPSFLNMAGQMGIFRGNGRLCFWDSANSVAWSSVFDLTDFTPSIENMVGNSTFLGVQGRIVTILPHGDGYIIYSTRSIVGVTYSTLGSLVWDAKTITSSGGIIHPKAACIGQNNQEHFAYTTLGIVSIGHFNALSTQYDMKVILPELFDYLKESRSPVYLQCHAARFLYFSLIDDSYINGITSFTDVIIPSLQAQPIIIDSAWMTDLNYGPGDTIFKTLDSFFRDPKGDLHPDYTANSYQVPRWVVTSAGGKTDLTARLRGFIKATEESQFSPARKFIEGGSPPYHSDDVIKTLVLSVASIIVNDMTSAFLLSIVADNFYGTNLDYQVHQHLYPYSDIPFHASNPHHNTCWDTFFELLSKYKETSELNKQYETAAIAAFNGVTIDRNYWILTNAAGTLDLNWVEPEPIIIPKKSPSIRITLDATTAYPTLQLDYIDTKGSRIIASVARSIISSNTTSFISGQPVHSATMVNGEYFVNIVVSINNNTLPNHEATWCHSFATEPTISDIVAAMTANPIYVLSEPMVLQSTFETSGYLNTSLSNNVLASSCQLKGINKPYLSVTGTFAVAKVIDETDGTCTFPWKLLSTAEVSWGLKDINRNDPFYYLSTIPYNSTYDGVMEEAYNFSSKYQLLEYVKGVLRIYGNTVYIMAHIYSQQADTIEIDVDSLYIAVSSGLASINHAIYGNAKNLVTGVNVVGVPLFGIYKYTDTSYQDILDYYDAPATAHNSYTMTRIQEAITLTVQEVSIRDFYPADSWGSFRFSRQAIDTYNKQPDGSYILGASASPVTVTVDKLMGGGFYIATTPVISLFPTEDNGTIFEYDSFGDMQIRRKTGPSTYEYANVANIFDHNKGKLHQYAMRLGAIPGITEVPSSYDPGVNNLGGVPISFIYPGATFVLQNGTPVPGYPTLVGSLVMDMHLKKWGKQAAPFKALLQFSPINATNNEAISYTNFGMDSGILDANDMKIKLFDVNPQVGFIRYGKIGYYRLGFTNALEVFFNFRTSFTGKIVLDGSVDNRDLEIGIQHSEDFTNVRSCIVNCDIEARWHTISIYGKFDLQYIEFRGKMSSRR